MAQSLGKPFVKVLQASAAKAATLNIDFNASNAFSYTVQVNCSAVTGTTPTLDVCLATSVDGGTTYVNLPLRFTQFTAAAVRDLIFRNGLGENEIALEQVVAATGGTLAKNCNFDPAYMRLVCTIGGTNPSFTFAAYLFAMPLGDLR